MSTSPRTLLVQLPIPQLNFGKQTGNIPLGGACLQMAADQCAVRGVEILPQSLATYLGDARLLTLLSEQRPDIIRFTIYAWNVDRALYFAQELKSRFEPFIVFGGPEVTPDNPKIRSGAVDLLIFGEGKAPFVNLFDKRSTNKLKIWSATLYVN